MKDNRAGKVSILELAFVALTISLLAFLFSFLFRARAFTIEPIKGQNSPPKAQIANMPPIGQNGAKNAIKWQKTGYPDQDRRFSQAEIDNMLVGTENEAKLRVLIRCESQNQNVARPDSNGIISYGLLQFNGTATWNQFAPQAGVVGSPMNPRDAIKVADWMISHGLLRRWSCAKLTGLL